MYSASTPCWLNKIPCPRRFGERGTITWLKNTGSKNKPKLCSPSQENGYDIICQSQHREPYQQKIYTLHWHGWGIDSTTDKLRQGCQLHQSTGNSYYTYCHAWRLANQKELSDQPKNFCLYNHSTFIIGLSQRRDVKSFRISRSFGSDDF